MGIGHTWFEGIQVCKQQRAQYKAALGEFESSAAEEPFSDILKGLGFNVSVTSALKTTTAPARTATIAAKVTHSVKETPMSTTDFVSNDDFFERFVKSDESVLLSTSHMMHALFFIF